MNRAWIMLAVLVAAAAPVRAQTTAMSEPEMLASAEQAMDDAARASADDPELAEHLYEEAAARYGTLIDSRHVESSGLYRAQGNAWLLSGDVGHAIASYRRAERLDPHDERTKESLAHARALVRTSVTPGFEDRVLRTVLWWRGWVPRSWVFGVFVLAFAAVWGVELARRVSRRRPAHVWAIGAGAVAAVTLGSLAIEHIAFRSVEHAVIVQRAVIAYTGPSDEVYPPAFETPLNAGVEAVVLAHREGWVRLRLADGREAWTPEHAIEVV